MKIYDNYSSKLKDFKSIQDGIVNMYVCGPTVYNKIHIGNARPLIVFDVVRRTFELLGYKVNYVSNITDVDDKIINKAIDEGVSEKEISNRYIKYYLENMKSLNCKTDIPMPKVTDYMNDIVNFIDNLIKKDFAYEVNGNVYFRVGKIDEYGKLSGQDPKDLIVGERISVNEEKENPLDFTLWKVTDKGITFEAPFSKGRPGWHTECVAMINAIFKNKIDIHAGGSDLRFPHHENEIAQSIALNNHNLSNFWIHNGRLNIDNKKMSKSLNNSIYVDDVLSKYSASAFRLFMLNTHYRSPINYTEDSLVEMENHINRINKAIKDSYLLLNDNKIVSNVEDNFITELKQDFNTPNCITIVFDYVKQLNQSLRVKDKELVRDNRNKLISTLEVLGIKINLPSFSAEEIKLYNDWLNYKKVKDFDNADKLRVELIDKGIL